MLKQCSRFFAAPALLAFALSISPARASVIGFYSDKASFDAAAQSLQTVTFSTLGTYNTDAGLTLGGVVFVGFDGAGYLMSVDDPKALPGDPHNYGFNVLRGRNDAPGSSYIQTTLPSDTTAIGMNMMSFWSGKDVIITLFYGDSSNSGPLTINTSAAAPAAYWGVTTTIPITSFQLAGTNSGQPMLANLEYGTAASDPAETPEVATFLMIGSGLVCLRTLRKRLPLIG